MIANEATAFKKDDATAELEQAFKTRASDSQPVMCAPREMARLWSLDEVAEFLNVSKAWVRDHATRRHPRIACVRMGGPRAILRFRRCDVERFINEHLQPAEVKGKQQCY